MQNPSRKCEEFKALLKLKLFHLIYTTCKLSYNIEDKYLNKRTLTNKGYIQFEMEIVHLILIHFAELHKLIN